MQAISETWRERRDDLEAQSSRLASALGGAARLEATDAELSPALLDAAERALARDYEPAFGGFGTAPKFPPSSAIELLLRRGSPEALGMVRRTLDGMAAGGLYDVVGGGFHRYSVDARWVVPHFEKMLYDNALLTAAYLHAWVVTGEKRYRVVVEETVAYLLREMLLEGGGFASAQDADTDGVEGLTYTWTRSEWEALGLDASLLEPFEHGREIVRGELDAATKARLLAVRAERPQPFRDDKAIASWNGLTLAALAEAARRLDRADWLSAAVALGEFLLGPSPRRRRARAQEHPRGEGQRGRLPRRPRQRRARACWSSTSPPATSAGCSRRAGSSTSPSTCSPTTSGAGSSSPPGTGRCSPRAPRTSTTSRSRPGTR